MVLWKGLNTESDPKVSFGTFPSRIIGNPSKFQKSVEGFLNIFDQFPLHLHLICLLFFGHVSSVFGFIYSFFGFVSEPKTG